MHKILKTIFGLAILLLMGFLLYNFVRFAYLARDCEYATEHYPYSLRTRICLK